MRIAVQRVRLFVRQFFIEYACGDRLKSVKSPFEIVKNSEKIVKI